MKVEIWSDVACPFCYIGKRQLETALERFEHRDEVEVEWRSFQLDPSMPERIDGNMDEFLAQKLGRTPEQAREMNARVISMAESVGLDYDFDRAQPSNTFDAHRLIHLGAAHGRQDAVKERLLSAYFTEGARLSDHETLVRLGEQVGLDGDEIRATLAGDAYAAAVRAEAAEAQQLGLGGVPAFVFDRAFLVSGAQPAEALHQALQQAWERQAEAAPPAPAANEQGPDGDACAVPAP